MGGDMGLLNAKAKSFVPPVTQQVVTEKKQIKLDLSSPVFLLARLTSGLLRVSQYYISGGFARWAILQDSEFNSDVDFVTNCSIKEVEGLFPPDLSGKTSQHVDNLYQIRDKSTFPVDIIAKNEQARSVDEMLGKVHPKIGTDGIFICLYPSKNGSYSAKVKYISDAQYTPDDLRNKKPIPFLGGAIETPEDYINLLRLVKISFQHDIKIKPEYMAKFKTLYQQPLKELCPTASEAALKFLKFKRNEFFEKFLPRDVGDISNETLYRQLKKNGLYALALDFSKKEFKGHHRVGFFSAPQEQNKLTEYLILSEQKNKERMKKEFPPLV